MKKQSLRECRTFFRLLNWHGHCGRDEWSVISRNSYCFAHFWNSFHVNTNLNFKLPTLMLFFLLKNIGFTFALGLTHILSLMKKFYPLNESASCIIPPILLHLLRQR